MNICLCAEGAMLPESVIQGFLTIFFHGELANGQRPSHKSVKLYKDGLNE